MSYVVCIRPYTERSLAFFNSLAAHKDDVSGVNVGLKEVIDGQQVDAEDFGWFVNDLQNARSVERVAAPDDDRHSIFRFELDELSDTTPAVIDAISKIDNRQGHAHIGVAYYEREDGSTVPVNRESDPVPFEV